ncbi:MAG: DUF3105 domain-containing protein [Chloroflexota bacterium]
MQNRNVLLVGLGLVAMCFCACVVVAGGFAAFTLLRSGDTAQLTATLTPRANATVTAATPPRVSATVGAPIAAVGIEVPDLGAPHVRPGAPHAAYNSMPPTSGPHYDTPAPWGKYDQAVVEETWIHNLEHSGIVALVNCPSGCADLVDKLDALLKTGPQSKFGYVKLLITPYSKTPQRLTLVAWTYYLPLADYDDALVRGFIAAHQDDGPEDVP